MYRANFEIATGGYFDINTNQMVYSSGVDHEAAHYEYEWRLNKNDVYVCQSFWVSPVWSKYGGQDEWVSEVIDHKRDAQAFVNKDRCPPFSEVEKTLAYKTGSFLRQMETSITNYFEPPKSNVNQSDRHLSQPRGTSGTSAQTYSSKASKR